MGSALMDRKFAEQRAAAYRMRLRFQRDIRWAKCGEHYAYVTWERATETEEEPPPLKAVFLGKTATEARKALLVLTKDDKPSNVLEDDDEDDRDDDEDDDDDDDADYDDAD